MKRSLLLICAGLIAATAASAQNQPAKSGPNNNAVNSPGQNNSNAPVAGRNSFTEGQAKSKIEEAGYTKVTDLKKTTTASGAARRARVAHPPRSASIFKAT